MALRIASAAKGTAPCNHLVVRVTDGAFDETEHVTLDELMEWLDNSPFKSRRTAVALAWLAYRVKVSGAAPASCVGVDIA